MQPPFSSQARAPLIMGVLNVTPDSFSDGGSFIDQPRALEHAAAMHEAGADIIDVGGESTRPGAAEVSVEQEIERVVPVIEAIRNQLGALVSVDSSKPEVMKAAVEAGAGMINDVFALRRPGALQLAAKLNKPVCLMHMQGKPGTMQQHPVYDDVLAEVEQFLLARAEQALAAGISPENIWLDPGFGFGKSPEHNLTLLRGLPGLARHGYGLLVGLSRKSLLKTLTGRPVDERLAGSLALALLAIQGGAGIIRVHDVAQTQDIIRVWQAFSPASEPEE